MADDRQMSPRASQVLADASGEAARLGHPYIGTEHLLLGLLRVSDGVAGAVLSALTVDRAALRDTVERVVTASTPAGHPEDTRPYTSRAQRALAWAREAATELQHSYLGTEHLLLGLTGEGYGIRGQVLQEHGVSYERARTEVVRILAKPSRPSPRGDD